LTFAGAVLLHFLWNVVNQLTPATPTGIALSIAGLGILVIVSLTLLIGRLREASRLRRSTDISGSLENKPPES
jgi:RsiW-degrading membrane proteinase PrsW (M82 family)